MTSQATLIDDGTVSVPAGNLPERHAAICLMTVIAAALLTSLMFPLAALAQFNGQHEIERHRLRDENFFDWKAYQPMQPWRYDSHQATNEMLATVGSLSQKRFYQFHLIRLEKPLNDTFSLLYHQLEDSFFRSEGIYQEIELRYGSGAYLSILGFPRHDKAFGNQGLALSLGSRENWNFLRLTHLQQYALYNEKTSGDFKYDPIPTLNRVELQMFANETLFVQATSRQETRAVREDPENALEESYEGQKLHGTVDLWFGDGFMMGVTLNSNEELRQRLPTDENTAEPTRDQTLRWGYQDAYLVLVEEGGDVWELGVLRAEMNNTITSTEETEDYRFDMMSSASYLFWQLWLDEGTQWIFSLQGGALESYEFRGESTKPPRDDTNPQAKAGVGIVVSEAESHRLFFNSTWDLDVFAQRQWDGGNVQLQLFF